MARRIGGAGGGSDKGSGKGKAGIVVAAAAVAGIVATSGGVSLGTASSTGTGNLSAGQNMSQRKADGKKSARNGNWDDAVRRLGMRSLKKTTRKGSKCASNSFGQVREFLIRTPCRSLERMLFAVGDDRSNVLLVSVAWVGFSARSKAVDFKELNDIHGTGDIAPLAGTLLEMADVRFTGRHYHSRRDGNTIVVAEAEAATGTVDDVVLDAATEIAVLLPRP
jgi:hypothetical protein